MQNHNRIIAKVTLASVIMIVLLYINFSIWGGTYFEGNLEYEVCQEMQLIHNSKTIDFSVREMVERMMNLLSIGFVPNVGGILLFYLSMDTIVKLNDKSIYVPQTLVALSVRLND